MGNLTFKEQARRCGHWAIARKLAKANLPLNHALAVLGFPVRYPEIFDKGAI